MKKKWIILIIVASVVIILAGLFIYFYYFDSGDSLIGSGEPIIVVPLPQEQTAKVNKVISESEFVEDVPKKGVISLRFFSFSGGEKVWHNQFLLNDGKIVSSGEPDIYLSLHAKYISEIDENKGNLCEIIQRANKNGDLGFYSPTNKVKLSVKYAGMLKHRKCFGF